MVQVVASRQVAGLPDDPLDARLQLDVANASRGFGGGQEVTFEQDVRAILAEV